MRRRIAALATGALLIGGLATGTARAQDAGDATDGTTEVVTETRTVLEQSEAFGGAASATALELTALGESATFGASEVTANSDGLAEASGAGQLLVQGTASEARVDGSGEQSTGQVCDVPQLPTQLADLGLVINTACSEASAAVVDGLPTAVSKGSVAEVVVSADTTLGTLGLDEPVDEAVGTVREVLSPVVDALTGVEDTLGTDVVQTVNDVVDDVLHTTTLRVSVGESLSEFGSAADRVRSSASASGGVVEVLPDAGVDGSALATIEVGSAGASAVRDRASEAAGTAEYDAALVRVTVNQQVFDALGLGEVVPSNTIEVAPGATECLLPEPLTTCITAADGEVVTNDDGSVGAIANAVRIHALQGLNGGIELAFAEAQAGIAGVPEVTRVETVSQELPRTGGFPLLPLAGAGLLATALVTRRVALRRAG